MKNIHLLPTPNPSRLFVYDEKLGFAKGFQYGSDAIQNQHIYITNDEEIKAGDYYIHNNKLMQSAGGEQEKNDYKNCKKIILTTDRELVDDGVQAIDDEFLEWFVKNPSCEEVGFSTYHVKGDISGKLYYKIIIPKEEPRILTVEAFNKAKISYKEPKQDRTCTHNCSVVCGECQIFEPKQETHLDIKDNKIELLEEDLECIRMYLDDLKIPRNDKDGNKYSIIGRIKWQQKRSYSEEEVLELLKMYRNSIIEVNPLDIIYLDRWFEQFKNK